MKRHCGPNVTPRVSRALRAMRTASSRPIGSVSRAERLKMIHEKKTAPSAPMTSQAILARGPSATSGCARGATVDSTGGGGVHAAFLSRGSSSVQEPACVRRHKTTQRGTSVSRMTIARWTQMPGASAMKIGSANHTTSNAKWRMMAGNRPHQRYSNPKKIDGMISSTGRAYEGSVG